MNDSAQIPRIKPLSSKLANQIAAGEVVERPVSVVKELLENALDAGATRIRIQLEKAGVSMIKVIDNGHGIHPDDLELALSSHATSKIRESSDLKAIHSLGFRGEALASIASVSNLNLKSAYDSSKQGVHLKQAADGSIELAPVAMNQGTSVEVRNLFFNMPARRKFLRTEKTEYLHIISLVKAMALCQFTCAFQLEQNGRRVLSFAKAENDYSRRVADVLGNAFVQSAWPFDFTHEYFRLWGWLGKPDIARSQSDKQYLYLNRRLIKDKHINHAIRMAFQHKLYQGRFPCYVLFLEMVPELFDVNVHPSKQEVRFYKSRDIHDFIYSCIQTVLSPDFSSKIVTEETVYGSDLNSEATHTPYVANEGQGRYQNNKLEKDGDIRTALKSDQDILKLKGRFGLLALDQGLLLFDSYEVRKEMTSVLLKQQISEGNVHSKPLLMPVKYKAQEEDLDLLEHYEDELTALGIIFKRVAPDYTSIRELSDFYVYIDLQLLVSNLIGHFKKTHPDVVAKDELILILLSHVNDLVPDQISIDDQTRLAKFCLQQSIHGNRASERKLWRILSEEDVKQFLST